MKYVVKILILLFFFSLNPLSAFTQERLKEYRIGYFAPFFSNYGGSLEGVFNLTISEKQSFKHSLQVSIQLGCFGQRGVSFNSILNPELIYRLNRPGKRFFIQSSIGNAYLLSFQKQDGVLNLSTGNLDYRHVSQHFYLPNLNVGFGIAPRNFLGLFFKATYGRTIGIRNLDSAFFAISTGLVIHISNNKL